MQYLIVFLFVLALADQRLTLEIERGGHLARLLRNKHLRAQRTVLRVVGGLGCLVYLWVLRSQL